jgi:hypothetical protein
VIVAHLARRLVSPRHAHRRIRPPGAVPAPHPRLHRSDGRVHFHPRRESETRRSRRTRALRGHRATPGRRAKPSSRRTRSRRLGEELLHVTEELAEAPMARSLCGDGHSCPSSRATLDSLFARSPYPQSVAETVSRPGGDFRVCEATHRDHVISPVFRQIHNTN